MRCEYCGRNFQPKRKFWYSHRYCSASCAMHDNRIEVTEARLEAMKRQKAEIRESFDAK